MSASRPSFLDRLLGRRPHEPGKRNGAPPPVSQVLADLEELITERAQSLEVARRKIADLTVRERLERGAIASGGVDRETGERQVEETRRLRAEIADAVDSATRELVGMRRRLTDEHTRAMLEHDRAETERLVAQFRLNKAKIDAVIEHAFGVGEVEPSTLEEAYDQLDVGRVLELDGDPED